MLSDLRTPLFPRWGSVKYLVYCTAQSVVLREDICVWFVVSGIVHTVRLLVVFVLCLQVRIHRRVVVEVCW